MTASPPPAILLPLVVALGATLGTIVIQALTLNAIIHFVRHETRLGHAGAAFWKDVLIVMVSALVALTAHLTDIFLWAMIYRWCGAITSTPNAIFFSAGNYTSVGAAVTIADSWRLLGPLETADGLLMFGVTTALLFAVIQRLVQARLGS